MPGLNIYKKPLPLMAHLSFPCPTSETRIEKAKKERKQSGRNRERNESKVKPNRSIQSVDETFPIWGKRKPGVPFLFGGTTTMMLKKENEKQNKL